MTETDNGWGFYCDIELEEVISQPEKKQQQQESQRLKLPILQQQQQQQQQESCIREATQHVVAICVMATIILFM